MSETTSFKRLILRAVLRDVYPMVIRLVAVPDYLELDDFDDIFHAVLGWDGGIGYTFQVHGQEFNSFRRRTRAKRLRDFGLHRQEKFQYTLGAIDQCARKWLGRESTPAATCGEPIQNHAQRT